MIYMTFGFYVLLLLIIPLQFYHLIQYAKKRANKLVSGFVTESHFSKGITLSLVSMAIVIIIGVLLNIIN